MKGLAESSPFHLLTNPHVINRFIFGHGVVIYYLMTSSEWKRQKLSESLQLKYRLISITCENHQISQDTLYIIYTYVIHLSFLPLKIRLNIISKFNIKF